MLYTYKNRIIDQLKEKQNSGIQFIADFVWQHSRFIHVHVCTYMLYNLQVIFILTFASWSSWENVWVIQTSGLLFNKCYSLQKMTKKHQFMNKQNYNWKSNIKTLKYNGLQHVNVVIGPCCMVIRCHSTGRQTQTFNIHDIQLKTLGDCCRLT